jgi:hypothetical protein
LVHDKVIEVLTGVALTAVTGPGAANDRDGIGAVKRPGIVGAVSRGDTGAVCTGDTGAVCTGDTGAVCTGGGTRAVFAGTGAVCTGETTAVCTGETGADAEAASAWKTTDVKIPAKPIIHTVRRTTKRFINTRFQSRSNPHRAA